MDTQPAMIPVSTEHGEENYKFPEDFPEEYVQVEECHYDHNILVCMHDVNIIILCTLELHGSNR